MLVRPLLSPSYLMPSLRKLCCIVDAVHEPVKLLSLLRPLQFHSCLIVVWSRCVSLPLVITSSVFCPSSQNFLEFFLDYHLGKKKLHIRELNQKNRSMSDRTGSRRTWPLDCKVYVGDLDPRASEREVEEPFSKIGPLK